MLGDANEAMSTIPGFNQIQFEGFCRFIDQGLTEELYKFPKIEDTDHEIEFQLFVERYQLVEPLIKERNAVYESLTYSSELYVSAGLIWKTSRDMQEQTILIGNIPLMNSLGTSIVNGIYRIVINQILQSPGIYYRSELDHNGISVYTGTIISDWGGRSELEIDRKARIWARVSRKQKISILVLSSAMGGDPVFSESLCKELQKKFFQQRCELGRIGRRNMNRRLNLDIPQNNTFLLPRDILAAADHLIGLKFGMADLLQDQFGLSLVRLENVVRGTICGAIRHKLIPTPQNLFMGEKLSYLGPGGLTGRTASFRIRDIHPSHYGRICPIDTSEGINVGLIGSLAIHARMGHWGSLESPFYEISERSTGLRLLYLSPGRDEYYMLAAGNSLALNQDIQEEQVVPARYRQEFLTIAWERFRFLGPRNALLELGWNDRRPLDSGALALAERGGKIVYIDTDKILFSGNGDTLSIPLVMYQRSNKNTCMHQKPRVQRGKCIKKGQILADGAATVGGELALGKNVLVAYMPWEGYNFEDAVLISERLVYEDIYTSFHIRKYEIQTHVTSQGPERITKEIPHLEAHLLRNLDKNGIVMLGSWVETGDILVGKLTPQMVKESSYAPEDRLLRAILGIQVSTSKETCLKLPIGGRGRVIDVRWIQKRGGSSYNPETIRVYISQKREIKVGDKVAGRHGNKGIISKNFA
ncbi:UNVERIFIED_CONTAM: DNA-directed RNA polymerase subunit beta [Sesamum indicum]